MNPCSIGWVDVGTGAKVRWICTVFHIKKIRKIEKNLFGPDLHRRVHDVLDHALLYQIYV
jgi:hypothetical protein